MKWNAYGFPIFDESDFVEDSMVATSLIGFGQDRLDHALEVSRQLRFESAKRIAADARARNFPPPCECRECTSVRNLPAVQRILAKWTPMDRGN